MAQKTNLNVSPYFEDFDSSKGYYKVLFAPGRAVQARELNNLQAQLQNQLERFGSHIFKDGSMVIPGGVTYDSKYYAVKLKSLQFGVDIGIYIQNFVGARITGTESGITAIVNQVVLQEESDEVEYITLYVKYLNSDINNEVSAFYNGESLFADQDITYGNTTISAGTNFATLIDEDATAVGSAAHVNRGIYFIRGFFVEVQKQTIILDYYNNLPSYKIGFTVNENIVAAKDDSTLYDNAKGFTNYAAPGADRFQLSLTLDKRLLENNADPDFIELIRTDKGEIKKEETTTQYSLIRDYLAKRTYDESGDYTVNPFTITVSDSLNNRQGNNGIFFSNELTDQGNIPSDNLGCVKLSPGVAYVGGYDVNKSFTTILDFEKPRTIESRSNISVEFNFGNILRVNNVYGCPVFGETISLYSRRKTAASGAPPGSVIGSARVYCFNLTDAPYEGNNTPWDLYLFDVQTHTSVTLNAAVSNTELPDTCYVRGKSSGASGYAVNPGGGSNVILLRQTSGQFVKGEKLVFNGIEEVSRTVVDTDIYGVNDIKSVYRAASGADGQFVADTILSKDVLPGFSFGDSFVLTPSGVVTSPGKFFTSVTPNTIVSYVGSGSDVHYNRVTSISADGTSMQLAAETLTISGVCNGTIGVSTTTTLPISLRVPSFVNKGNGGLYATLPAQNIANVDLSNSTMTFKAQAKENAVISSNVLTLDSSAFDLPVGLSTASFNAFDQERYSIHYTTGTIESLSSDQVVLDGSTNQITFSGISNGTRDYVVGTLVKRGIKSKTKVYNKSKIIDYSYSRVKQSGTNSDTSISDGLTYNNVYGIRVQDEDICLLYPDVARVLCVYESLDQNAPKFDQLEFSSLFNVSTNVIVGENIIGQESGAMARVVRKPVGSPNNIEFVYLNPNRFVSGETVTFTESDLTAVINSIVLGEYKKITNRFLLDKGQKNQYYDYSRLIRINGEEAPSRKISVVLDYYSVPSNDTGDVYTVLSYPSEQYSELVPIIGNNVELASNTLDFRPRVASITDITSLTTSPFDFDARSNLADDLKIIPAPNEIAILGIGYYLPRIDKVYLNRRGEFSIEQGKPDLNPKPPEDSDLLMPLATIFHPAYLDNARSSFVELNINKRYTMKDIGRLDSRLTNLERTTTLSLLEVNTEALQIRDADGINQFKTGFFVDDFDNDDFINDQLSNVEAQNGAMIPFEVQNTLPNVPELVDSGQNDPLNGADILKSKDGGIRFTGTIDDPKTLTLDYTSIDWIEQPIATRVENINPFHVVEYVGEVSLSPEEDQWVRSELKTPEKVIKRTNKFRVNVTNTNTVSRTIKDTRVSNATETLNSRRWLSRFGTIGENGDTIERTNVSVSRDTDSNSSRKTSKDVQVSENINTVRRLIDTKDDKFIRSRNVEFRASNLKPFTRHYQFFDNQSGVKVIPKLLKVTPISGKFSAGEDVIGYPITSGSGTGAVTGKRIIRFRLAQPNHKRGQATNPTQTYTTSPYDRNTVLPSTYSNNTEYLNIATDLLSREADGEYSGYLTKNVRFVGQTSGAIAELSSADLITDIFGDLIGTFFLDDPNSNPVPSIRIITGTKTYKLTSSQTNTEPLPGSTDISRAETTYDATGTVNTFQDETTIDTTRLTTVTTTVTNINTTTITKRKKNTTLVRQDPLAQSFEVGKTSSQAPTNSSVDPVADSDGAFLTAVDIYFRKVDSGNSPVIIQIRSMQLGTPTLQLIGESVVLRPNDILPNGRTLRENVSENASVATTVVFPYPIYLAPDDEYALVLLAPQSIEYEVFIAEMNEASLNQSALTGLPEAQRVKYSKQFAIGSLFKSQNGSIWTADQNQDLKFKLYKAQFDSVGTAFFYNPVLNATSSASYFGPIGQNPIQVYPKKLEVKLTPASALTELSIGSKVTEETDTWKYGFVEDLGGPVSTIGVTTSGFNYVTENGLDTYNISGNGDGLIVNITASGGAVQTISVGSTAGSGYKVGDVVGIVTSSTSSGTGLGGRFTINSITNYDTVYLTNFQGTGFIAGRELRYYSSGTPTALSTPVDVVSATVLDPIYQGNIAKINQFTHGMYSTANKVELADLATNSPPRYLSSNVQTNTNQINVNDASIFQNFELIPVSASNPGYIIIQDEIISYTGVSGNSLTGVTRGVDSTVISIYSTGQPIYKYELNGVSLRRLNNVLEVADYPTDIDGYYVEFNRGAGATTGRDRISEVGSIPELSFSDEGFVGGDTASATKNLVFNKITPSYDVYGPGSKTSVSAAVRTVSATSAGGEEIPFLDNGYQPVQLNNSNQFTTLRAVYSKANEDAYLGDLPNSKSFTTAITLKTQSPNLSPQIFLDGSVTNYSVPRLDKPVDSYIIDGRANQISDLSHAATYVSNLVTLKQPSTSLKVLVSAYRPFSSDFRVLYSLILEDSSEVQQSFTLFPGYNNLTLDNDQNGFLDVVDLSQSDGLPDRLVPPSVDGQFLEYEYTAPDLPKFIGYSIKIVMSGTDQANVPSIDSIRTIALA